MFRRLSLLLLVACGGSHSGTGNGPDAPNGSNTIDAPGGPTVDAAPPMPSHNVAIIVEPNGQNGQELVNAIKAAHTSVYMTMYQISSTNVINALVARKQAGLDVQAILDSSTQSKSFNTSAYNTLNNAGVNVVWSSSAFTYTHEKTVMIDGTSAWIMTMNANTSSPSSNREYLALDTDAADVAEATAIFQKDHALQAVTPTGPLIVAPTNARPELVALIDSATQTLDVEGEEFSDTYSTGVVNAVARAATRGVTVHVVIATGNVDATSVNRVKSAGAHVVTTGPTSGNGTATNPYIHAKAIVADGARAFVGSENFSGGSLGYNRELGVIFDVATEVSKVKTTIDGDFTKGTPQ
ncbi:MAG: cardiolipin synthase [Deltaproteobacteria bacterium]|nr:cardiolipin synthase [Deltaproteobacteria bacterium]